MADILLSISWFPYWNHRESSSRVFYNVSAPGICFKNSFNATHRKSSNMCVKWNSAAFDRALFATPGTGIGEGIALYFLSSISYCFHFVYMVSTLFRLLFDPRWEQICLSTQFKFPWNGQYTFSICLKHILKYNHISGRAILVCQRSVVLDYLEKSNESKK